VENKKADLSSASETLRLSVNSNNKSALLLNFWINFEISQVSEAGFSAKRYLFLFFSDMVRG